MSRPARQREWVILAAITLGAGLLRIVSISKVSPDPFYDAAVRSMELSWHNFFFGAFEPGGSVSIDKPPVDLWLQVASVKLLGFSSSTLKVPEVLGGTLAVPLLFSAVRRMWSPGAGLAAALALAVLPVSVITARSDTMDGVMMVLIVLGLLFVVRAVESDSTAWLLAAAGALGLAFNVKLLESLVAMPGIAVLAFLGMAGTYRRRLARMALAGVLYVVVALAWLTATLLAPAHERPFSIGSTNGSAWNAAFIFNGTERLSGASVEPGNTVYQPGHHYPQATQSERDHIPIVPASATRLLARVGPLSGERLGLEVLVALLLGIPALLWGLRGAPPPESEPAPERSSPRGALRSPGATPLSGEDALPGEPVPPVAASVSSAPSARGQPAPRALERGRMDRALAGGLGVWMLTGIVLFSHMARLHPRYVEGFTPVVAAMLGIGVAWVSAPLGRLRPAVLAGALVITVYYAERLLYGATGAWWIALLGALGAIVLSVVVRLPGPAPAVRSMLAPGAVMAGVLVAALAIPLSADFIAIENHVTDAGYVGALPSEEQQLVSSYLRAHQDGARYELAAESATQIGSLIVQDARPVLVLTTYAARVFTPIARLKRLIAEGQVRYAFLNSFCSRHGTASNPACSAPARWVRAHGRDVSRAAGLHQHKILWLLPGARP